MKELFGTQFTRYSVLPRLHLGQLARLPAELLDMIFAHLDLSVHIASFGAAHPLLFAHGFACILRDRLEMVGQITWTNTRIVCVGDYL